MTDRTRSITVVLDDAYVRLDEARLRIRPT